MPLPARPEEYYLRCTCPATNKIKFSKEKFFEGIHIVIVPRGGTHIIDKEKYNIYSKNSRFSTVVLSLNDEFNFLNPYVILAWLKSSLATWYSYSLFGSTDIYVPSTFSELIIPAQLFHNDTANILEDKIKEIVEIENLYLKEQADLVEKYTDEESEIIMEHTIIHNQNIDCVAYQIDQIINEKISLRDDEVQILSDFFKIKNFHSLEVEVD